MIDKRCDTCSFWKLSFHGVEGKHPGICRRYPPRSMDYLQGDARFPETTADVWCGEWKYGALEY